MAPRAIIFGCEGSGLTSWESGFFKATNPVGFILFARNCESPQQVRDLVIGLRESVGRPDAPVLIDQEGGRVQRLNPPHWRAAPPAARFGQLAQQDGARAREAVNLNARLIAAELNDLGITVGCLPVLDLRMIGAHSAIGDRSYGADPDMVATLGRACCQGLLAGGVLPVIKHIPGHGRGLADSHHELPKAEATIEELERTDFSPFRNLNDMPWGMTAHVLYAAIDPIFPATISKKVIGEIIRGSIGFDGLLVSDDLSMEALEGEIAHRATQALEAGCDVALHCNGKRDEMEAIAGGVGELTADAVRRLGASLALLVKPEEADRPALTARLDALLASA